MSADEYLCAGTSCPCSGNVFPCLLLFVARGNNTELEPGCRMASIHRSGTAHETATSPQSNSQALKLRLHQVPVGRFNT